MLLAGQAGVFTHDGEDFLMSCQKGSTVFFPVQTRLPATKIGWRGAIILLQLLLLYGTMKPDRQYEHGFYPYWRGCKRPMAYDKEKRYSIETINVYYKSANDMVIIGCFNDPHGPRRECGQPYVIRESVSPEKLGSILSNLYDKCLQFSKDDLSKQPPPFTQATGIKSWTKFAKGRKVINIEWNHNGNVLLERWKWYPDGGFGPDELSKHIEMVAAGNFTTEMGNAVFSLIAQS